MDKDKAPIIVEADLRGGGEESLFSKIESLLSDDSGEQNTGTEMSQAGHFHLQAYQNASQVLEIIMSQGLQAIVFNPKLLGQLQELLNFLVEQNAPEVSTIGHQCVYLKLQNFIQTQVTPSLPNKRSSLNVRG